MRMSNVRPDPEVCVDHGISGFKKSIFISHASKNFKIADELRELLESRGVSCWIAPRDIPPGYQYGAAIIEAIRECTVTLLLLTDDSNMSKSVENEIERAFGYQKTIIPIRLREVKPSTGLEFFISNAQWVDAIVSPLKSRVDQIINIVHALEMSKPIPTPEPEKRTFMGVVERFLEQLFRHKIISAVAGFLILVALGGAGLYFQSRTHFDLSGIDKKLDKVKLETSEDPRKELANIGVAWNEEQFAEAVNARDLRTVSLFIKGKIRFRDSYTVNMISKMFLAENFQGALNFIEYMHQQGFDFNKEFDNGYIWNGPYGSQIESKFRMSPLAYAWGDPVAMKWLLSNNDISVIKSWSDEIFDYFSTQFDRVNTTDSTKAATHYYSTGEWPAAPPPLCVVRSSQADGAKILLSKVGPLSVSSKTKESIELLRKSPPVCKEKEGFLSLFK